MEMREFGGVGMQASVIGFGCNSFGIDQDAGRRLQLCASILVRDAEKEIIP